jgi:DNA repair protein RadC
MSQMTFYPNLGVDSQEKYLPVSEQPTRRVAESPAACNIVELLAAQIGGNRSIETAQALLTHYGSPAAISTRSSADLMTFPGIGKRAAIRLLAALELGRRVMQGCLDQAIFIHSPADVASLVQYDLGRLEQEELWVLLLNTRQRLIGIDHLYRGSVSSSQVRVGEVFKAAIRCNAVSIIVTHNHPGADPTPSPEDILVTKAIFTAGKNLDISLIDHIIVGGEKFVSLKERGILGE